MKKGETINDYFGKVMTVANKMRLHGEKTIDDIVVEKILRSLTPKFNYVVCSIEESNIVEDMFIDELQSSLLMHEQRITRTCVVEEM